MTSREARNRRRAEERREAKLASKAAKSGNVPSPAAQCIEPASPVRPSLQREDEFANLLRIKANALRDRIHRKAGKPVDAGFVSQAAPEPSRRAEINRANAQYSTGPKTSRGKLASSGNSLKHGLASGTILIPGEDPTAFEALLLDLLREHQPASATEELLVSEMAQSYWLAQRAIRFQNECFTETAVDQKRLALFLRYQTTHDRCFHKALATLIKFQNRKHQRPVAAARFVSQSAAHPHETGFVPQDDPERFTTGISHEEFVPQNRRVVIAEAA